MSYKGLPEKRKPFVGRPHRAFAVFSAGLLMMASPCVLATQVENQAQLDEAIANQDNPIEIVANAGNLTVAGTDTIAENTDLHIGSDSTLLLNGNQTLGALSGNGTLDIGTNALTVGGNNTNSAFSGTISLAGEAWQTYGTFHKTGLGALTIDGATITMGEAFVEQGLMLQTSGNTYINYLGVGSGASNLGEMNVSGGTLTIRTALQVGDWGGEGVFNQTGGDVILPFAECGDSSRCTSMNIGNQGGTGVYNISGGTLQINGGRNIIGRSTRAGINSTGTLNIVGGLVQLKGQAGGVASMILGWSDKSGNQSKGTITQTGGVLRLDEYSALYLSSDDADTGIYNLNGGVLETGGARLQGRYNTSSSTYEFNLGGGTIRLIDDATMTNLDATLMSGTVSTIDTNAYDAQWSGVLSGDGGLAKNGEGTFTHGPGNSDATYSGETLVNGGTFKAGMENIFSGNSAFTIASGATLDLDNFNNEIGSIAGAGNVVLGTATLKSGHNGASTSFSGSISGSGEFNKVGIGVLTLSGNSSSFTGTTTLSNGGLVINNALGGNLNTASATTLRGTGVIGNTGSTATINGYIQPGSSSVGTITFNGDYAQESGSVYNMEVLNPEQYNFIRVAGSAALNAGSQLSLLEEGLFPIGNLSILHADGGVTGQYSSFQEASRPFLTMSLLYGTNDVYLSIARNSLALSSFALTPNEASVANAIDSFSAINPANPLYVTMMNVSDTSLLPPIFDSLSGQVHAAALSAYVEESRYLRDAVLNRLEFLHNNSSAATNPAARWWNDSGLWMEGYGAWGHINSPSSNTTSLKRKNGGLFLGLDMPLREQWRAGIVAGVGQTSLDMQALSSKGNSNNAYLGLYTSAEANKFTGYLGAAYAWHHLNTRRFVESSIVTDSLHASYQVPYKQIFAEAGYDLYSHLNLNIKPFLQAAYVDVNRSSFTESGGISALTGFKATDSLPYSTAGIRMNANLGSHNDVTWHARALLGWQHAYQDIYPVSPFAFTGGASFLITGVPIARDAALVDAAIDVGAYGDNLHFILGYLSQLSSRVKDNGVQGTISYRFA